MKAKQTNKHGEKKKRKNRKAKLEVDKGDLYILKNKYDRKRIRKATPKAILLTYLCTPLQKKICSATSESSQGS